MESLSPADPRYQKAALIADAVLATDTGSYCGRNSLPESNSRSGAARRFTAVMGAWRRPAYGRHTFYSPNEGYAGPQPTVLTIGLMADFEIDANAPREPRSPTRTR